MISPKIKTVGAYEAKTRLPALLKEVALGREIVITNRDRPVARILPVETPRPDKAFFKRLRAFRERYSLPKGETTSDLVKVGRRI